LHLTTLSCLDTYIMTPIPLHLVIHLYYNMHNQFPYHFLALLGLVLRNESDEEDEDYEKCKQEICYSQCISKPSHLCLAFRY